MRQRVQVERGELVITPTQLRPAPRSDRERAVLAVVHAKGEARRAVGRTLLEQLHVPGWVVNAAGSATLAGPHCHTAASHWALGGSTVRPECVGQPGACMVSPSRLVSCGTSRTAL